MMTVSLPPDLEKRVRGEVTSGRYGSVDEAIAQALRLMLDEEQNLDEIRAMIDQGFAEAEAGLLHTPDEARALLDAHRRTRDRAADRGE